MIKMMEKRPQRTLVQMTRLIARGRTTLQEGKWCPERSENFFTLVNRPRLLVNEQKERVAMRIESKIKTWLVGWMAD